MIREKDKPYIQAIKEIQGENITSNTIDEVVHKVNQKTGLYYTGNDVIKIMLYCEIIDIRSHLGQPRQGEIINGGRLHSIKVYA